MFLSVIIPLHNGQNTIQRTLDSISKQNFDDIELIIVDDNSSDKSLDIINRFKASIKFPIIIIQQNIGKHCAGNSRQSGLNIARGDWVTFIDQDDEFFENAFIQVKKSIIDNNLKYYFASNLWQQSETHPEFIHILKKTNTESPDSWLHGKVYNKKNLIDKYDISFKKDLIYLEDIYFNNQVLQALYLDNIINDISFEYFDFEIYKWYFDQSTNTGNNKVTSDYTHNDWGLAVNYCEIVVPFYEQVLLNARSDEIKYLTTAKLMASFYYVFLAHQNFIEKYGIDSSIVEILINNIVKYYKIVWQIGLKDGDIVEYFWARLNEGMANEQVPNYIYEDPLCWIANIKSNILKENQALPYKFRIQIK